MKMKNLLPTVVLVSICIVVAVLLGVVNMITAPVIEEADRAAVAESLKIAMPDGEFDSEPDELASDAPETVKAVYTDKNGGGHVVVLVTTKGYTGKEIGITVGIDKSGKIVKAVVTKNEESIVPSELKPMGSYGDAYTGATASTVPELVTGATVVYTEGAIKSALYDAFSYLGYAEGSLDATPDTGDKEPISPVRNETELHALASGLVGEGAQFSEVYLYSKPRTLVRLYEETSGKGYVAYIVVPGDYVAVATEGLVYLNRDAEIVGVNLLQWVVGHGTTPGSFADGFVGKDYWHMDEVELVSGSTGTSGDFHSAVAEAVRVVTDLVPRSEEKILELADELVYNSRGFEKHTLPADAPSTLKALYKETSGKGYVAYVVTAGEYVAIATEALVHFNPDGVIEGMNLLTWTVGHGVSAGDFAEGFVGKSADDIDTVELVSSATVTAGDLRDAVADVFPCIPYTFPAARVVGIAIIVLAVCASVAIAITVRKRRSVK